MTAMEVFAFSCPYCPMSAVSKESLSEAFWLVAKPYYWIRKTSKYFLGIFPYTKKEYIRRIEEGICKSCKKVIKNPSWTRASW